MILCGRVFVGLVPWPWYLDVKNVRSRQRIPQNCRSEAARPEVVFGIQRKGLAGQLTQPQQLDTRCLWLSKRVTSIPNAILQLKHRRESDLLHLVYDGKVAAWPIVWYGHLHLTFQ